MNQADPIRTEPLTKADRRLIKDYRDSRQKLINLAAEGQSLAKRMHDAEAAVPMCAAKLATTLSIRLGFACYQELKDNGLDLSIDSKAGTVAVIKAAKIPPVNVEALVADESTEDVREDLKGEVEP